MRVFKSSYKDRSGKRHEIPRWYVELRDHLGVRRRVPAMPDKRASEAIGRRLEEIVNCRAAGETLPVHLTKWIETVEPRLRTVVGRMGIIDAGKMAAMKPLAVHVDDWKKQLADKNTTPRYVSLAVGRVRRLLKGCGFIFWSDIDAGRLAAHLATLRAGGMSAQTSNHHLTVFKGFCKWMAGDGKQAMASPVAHLKRVKVEEDRRYERRAMEPAELCRLIQAAEQGPPYRRMTGPDRAMLYRVAIGTGYRAAELRALERAHLKIYEDRPRIVLPAKHTKNRKDAWQPIRADLAEMLRGWMAGRTARRIFPTMPDRTADMLHRDLRRARARWIRETSDPAERRQRRASDFLAETDESGCVADFHGLRVSYITEIVKGGASIKEAQTLARHSVPELTMNIYTKLGLRDYVGALDALPPVAGPAEPQRMRATGTTDATAEKRLASCLAPRCRKTIKMLDPVGHKSQSIDTSKNAKNAQKTKKKGGFQGSSRKPPVGLEPTTCGLQNRCSANGTPVTNDKTKTYDATKKQGAPLGRALGAVDASADPDFEAVVAAWPDLPAPIRVGIVATVRAALAADPANQEDKT